MYGYRRTENSVLFFTGTLTTELAVAERKYAHACAILAEYKVQLDKSRKELDERHKELDERLETAKKARKDSIQEFKDNRSDPVLGTVFREQMDSAKATVDSLQERDRLLRRERDALETENESLVLRVVEAADMCSTISRHLLNAVGLVRFSFRRWFCYLLHFVLQPAEVPNEAEDSNFLRDRRNPDSDSTMPVPRVPSEQPSASCNP
jgi:hypothetical protein